MLTPGLSCGRRQERGVRLTSFILCQGGALKDQSGDLILPSEISVAYVSAPHLSSHLAAYELPKGDIVKVRVIYSSHCWSRAYDAEHSGQIRFLDGLRPRGFCEDRYRLSFSLRELIEGLPTHKIYMTAAERNFGAYCATKILSDGTAYTAFFTLRGDKGRFDGARHRLTLYVESAYMCPQPDQTGQKTGFPALINSALTGRPLTFKR